MRAGRLRPRRSPTCMGYAAGNCSGILRRLQPPNEFGPQGRAAARTSASGSTELAEVSVEPSAGADRRRVQPEWTPGGTPIRRDFNRSLATARRLNSYRRGMNMRPLRETNPSRAVRPDRAFPLVARSVYGRAALMARPRAANPAGGRRPSGYKMQAPPGLGCETELRPSVLTPLH